MTRVEFFERRSAHERLERVKQLRVGSWVHISGEQLDFAGMAKEFLLNENIIRDIADIRELPRAEYSDNAEYIFVRLPVGAADAGKTAPLLAVVGSARFVTITEHTTFSPLQTDVFLTTIADRPAELLPAVIASGVADYEQRIRVLTARITDARNRLAKHEVENADFIEFVAIEDSLNEYHSCLGGLLTVLNQLTLNRRHLFHSSDIEALNDITLHVNQLLVAISASVQTITSIQNAYSTIANNTLNQRMKLLTAITILLAIPNVFYGMYGMNIALPIQHEPWAYPVIIILTAILPVVVYLAARRIKLL